MKNILIAQNAHWEKPYVSLYERTVFANLLTCLKTKHIQVLQGIRRSGKSSLFKMLINHLSQQVDAQEILYLNLDDPFFTQYANDPKGFYKIVQTAEKLTQKTVKYLFLDEVQAISGWEKYVKSVYDNDRFTKIFVTGSNASLLNSEFATLLTGRYLSIKVYPLSFKELLHINGINNFLALNKQLPKVLKIVDDMMQYGSFVEIYQMDTDLKRDLLSSYYDTILCKDCIANNAIRDSRAFRDLAFYCLTNLTALYSYSSLSKAVKLNDRTVKEHLSVLESCYLFGELNTFSYSLKTQINNKKKLYLCDNGFLALSYSFSANYGKLLENLVFTELQKMGYDIYFYNKARECDFIAKKDNKTLAIQVCYELSEQNKYREINGLLKLPFAVDEKYIITYNQSDELEGIKVISFWEYCCGLKSID